MTNAINTTANGPGRIFNATFNRPEVIDVEFNPAWNNGTGYFDAAVFSEVPGLYTNGRVGRCFDDSGRRLLIIKTRFGNVIVFDRFSHQTDGGVYVTNSPVNPLIRLVVSGSSVGETEMIALFGGWGILEDNLGFAIEKIAKLF